MFKLKRLHFLALWKNYTVHGLVMLVRWMSKKTPSKGSRHSLSEAPAATLQSLVRLTLRMEASIRRAREGRQKEFRFR